jgi:hypothetical protein
MQRVELLVIVGAVGAFLIVLALRYARAGAHGGRSLQLVVGAVVGVTAAFIALVLNVDLVPDRWETVVGPLVVVGVTSVAIVGTALRLARR